MKQYTIDYERDEDGWWVASVRGVKGCHSQGRTLRSAKDRVREALGLFRSDASEAEFIDVVPVPRAAKNAIRRWISAKERADKEQKLAQDALRDSARALHAVMSLRDAATVLALSHQRLQQVLDPNP